MPVNTSEVFPVKVWTLIGHIPPPFFSRPLKRKRRGAKRPRPEPFEIRVPMLSEVLQ
jgi:hypothetical protein